MQTFILTCSLSTAVFFLEYWKRKEITLAYQWDVLGFEEEEVRDLKGFSYMKVRWATWQSLNLTAKRVEFNYRWSPLDIITYTYFGFVLLCTYSSSLRFVSGLLRLEHKLAGLWLKRVSRNDSGAFARGEKFGYLCIQEILVVIKLSVPTSVLPYSSTYVQTSPPFMWLKMKCHTYLLGGIYSMR